MNFVFAPYEKLSIKNKQWFRSNSCQAHFMKTFLCVSAHGYSLTFQARSCAVPTTIWPILKIYTCNVEVLCALVLRSVWVCPYRSVCVTRSPCFASHLFYAFFFLNVLCQYTPLRNLRLHVFGLTPFRWLRTVTLTLPIHYFLREYHFWFTCFLCTPAFVGTRLGRKTRPWFIIIIIIII